jgi:hypothetical protein
MASLLHHFAPRFASLAAAAFFSFAGAFGQWWAKWRFSFFGLYSAYT